MKNLMLWFLGAFLIFLTRSESKSLKIFIHELPPDNSDASYTKYWEEELKHESPDNVRNKLTGELLSIEESTYKSWYLHFDMWWLFQMKNSSLRVKTAEESDIIFIPLSINQDYYWLAQYAIKTLDESSFPYLQTKPHIVVINHPVSLKTYWTLFATPNKHLFTVISIGGQNDSGLAAFHTENPNKDIPFVVAPYFWRQHLSANSTELQESWSMATKKKITARKAYMFSASWKDRKTEDARVKVFYQGRDNYKQQCLAHPDDCKWDEFSFDRIMESQHVVQNSWYAMQAIGDLFSRCSVFDVLVTDTIPILHPQVYPHLPFTDYIDYSEIALFREDNDTNVIRDIKANFSAHAALTMIQAKYPIKHIFQKSLFPNHSLVRFERRDFIDAQDDAFTFTLKTLLRQLCSNTFYKLLKCD